MNQPNPGMKLGRPARVRLALKRLALLTLLAGVAMAAGIWLAQDRAERQAHAQIARPPQSARLVDPLSPEDSRRYTHDAELYYGKTGMLLDRATRRLEGLTHGKPLAWTIAVGSTLLAGAIFLLGHTYQRGASLPTTDRWLAP